MNDERTSGVQPRTDGFLASPASHLQLYMSPVEKQQVVPFRSWYISNYCNEEHLSLLLRLQKCCPSLQRAITIYFKIWSCTGETEFYTAFFPLMAWLGLWPETLDMSILMCLSQYLTGTLKDAAGCPRPPCPPVEIRGRANASKEYGYPSTHASHSVLFAYSIYNFLILLFPEHPVGCVVICVVFAVNVSLSRLFLGMHWPADLVAGFAVAGLILLSHIAFLQSWIMAIVSLTTVGVWHYLLAFIVMHVLAVSHAAPREFCPCYLDSLRFLGATLGALFGGWAFYAHYGTYTARTQPEDLCGTLFSWEFLLQYICGLFVLVIGKTIASFAAKPLLRWFFISVSRRTAPNRLWLWRQVRALLSEVVRCAYCIPLCEEPNTAQRKTLFDDSSACLSNSIGVTTEIPLSCKDDGEKTPQEDPVQLWSPRTHRHWWLWEAHKCTVSYTVVGFMIMYVCQVVLRVCFHVS